MTDQRTDWTRGEDRLNELRAQIGELLKKLENAVGTEAEALRPKLEAAHKKLCELKETTVEAWDDLKPGLQKAWEELHNALNQAASRFKSHPRQ